MSVPRAILCFFVTAMLCISLVSCPSVQPSVMTFGCIDYAPFTSLNEDGEIVGVEAEMLRAACGRIGVEPRIMMYDAWDDAYNRALRGPMKAVITASYTPERKDLFKWAGPLNRVPFWLLSEAAAGTEFDSLEGSQQLDAIAAVRGWAETAELEKLGFTNILYCDSLEEMIGKVLDREAQAFAHAIPMKGTVFTDGERVLELGEVRRHFAYHVAYHYIAFSKSTPDAVVESYQSGIDQILLDGTASAIKNDYVAVNLVPYGKIQIFTENNPPFNFVNRGQTTAGAENNLYSGSSVEIVRAIEDELGVQNPITQPLWYVGYSIAQYLPYSAIFSTVRNAEREDLFHWVGPIATWEPVFCTLETDGIVLDTLDDVRNHAVATVRDWADVATLVDNQIPYIVGDDLQGAFGRFLDGDADVFYIDKLSLAFLAESHELTMDDFRVTSFFEPKSMYIAFSKDTPAQVAANWQGALDDLKATGKFQAIWEDWYPGLPLP